MLVLEEIKKNKKSITALYRLLSEREFNISHKHFPSFEKHENFVLNHPYRKWFFVKKDDVLLGTIYFQFDNSVGINLDFKKVDFGFVELFDLVKKKISPLKPVPSKVYSQFFVNVPIKNKNLSSWLEEGGCISSQVSYEISEKK